MADFEVLRWGVAGAGKISSDFVRAVQCNNPNGHQFVAVASQTLDSATKFAEKFSIETSYGSYSELALDSRVQVVYIGNLNFQHYPTAKLFLEHGKHVLLEKPLTMNAKQTESILKLAKEKNLLLMEALWSRFLPAYTFVMEKISEGAIGEVQKVKASFGFEMSEVDRIKRKELGGGTILDLGVYCISLLQMVYGNEFPESISASGRLNEIGVDLTATVELVYSGGRRASFETSALSELDNTATITGSKGSILMKSPFHCCERVEIDGKPHVLRLPPVNGYHFPNSSGLVYEANEIRRILSSGKLESNIMPHSASLTIATISDAIREQVGVKFDVD